MFAIDKKLNQKNNLINEIKRASPFVKKLFNKKNINLNNLKLFTSLRNAVKDADFLINSLRFKLKFSYSNITIPNFTMISLKAYMPL